MWRTESAAFLVPLWRNLPQPDFGEFREADTLTAWCSGYLQNDNLSLAKIKQNLAPVHDFIECRIHVT
jgi:hypothetical protein